MANQIRHPEFLTEMGPVNYPFADKAALSNAENDFFAPDTFIDAIFYPIGGGARLYISKVTISSVKCVFTLGDEDNLSVATGTFEFDDVLAATDTERIAIKFIDEFDRPAGMIVSDKVRLAIFQTWSIGEHAFDIGSTELVATVCIPTPEIGLRGIVLDDGSFFAGDIWMVGEDGVVLSRETVIITKNGEQVTYPTIRVDIVGDPLFQRRLCASAELFQTPRFIKTLTVRNSCRNIVLTPDERGDIGISVGVTDAEDTVLRISPLDKGIVFTTVGETLGNISG